MCSIVWDKSMGISKKRLPTNYEQKVPGSYVSTYWPTITDPFPRIKKKHGETMRNRSCMFMSFHVPAKIPYDSRPKDGRSLEVVRSAALADLWPGSSPSSFYSFAFRFKTWPIKINGLHQMHSNATNEFNKNPLSLELSSWPWVGPWPRTQGRSPWTERGPMKCQRAMERAVR